MTLNFRLKKIVIWVKQMEKILLKLEKSTIFLEFYYTKAKPIRELNFFLNQSLASTIYDYDVPVLLLKFSSAIRNLPY